MFICINLLSWTLKEQRIVREPIRFVYKTQRELIGLSATGDYCQTWWSGASTQQSCNYLHSHQIRSQGLEFRCQAGKPHIIPS